MRFEQECGNGARRRREGKSGDPRTSRARVENAAQGRTAAHSEKRHADHEIRQVIAVRSAEESGLRYLEEESGGGDQADANVPRQGHRRRLRSRSVPAVVKLDATHGDTATGAS